MTLNQQQTSQLKTALDAQTSYFHAQKNDTRISNEQYDAWRQDFIDWQEAYAGEGLIITTPNGNTQPLSGIDQVPIPPAR